jgi:hypothetical protein
MKMADKNKLKGIMVFYINMYPDLGQQLEPTLTMIKEMNRPLMDKLTEDGNYVCLLVPTTKEATRVEKVDYDSPFPRYMPQSADVNRCGLKKDVQPKKPKRFFGEAQDEEAEEEPTMRGFITLFVNFHPDVNLDPNEVMKLIQKMNKENLATIIEDGQYQIMFVPTTKEASRIEKVDYDMPFPRLMPKTVSKTKTGIVTPVPKVEEEEEDDGPHDEIEDEELEEDKE